MSSLHQDRLPTEGSVPVPGTRTTPPAARTPSGVVGTPEVQPTSEVPAQRQGEAERTGTAQPEEGAGKSARRTLASRARTATAKSATAGTGTAETGTAKAPTAKAATGRTATAKAASLKAATTTAATTKAATVKAATAKAATAARSAAVATVANRTAGVRSARAAAAAQEKPAGRTSVAKPAASKPAASKPAASKPAASKAPAADPADAALSPARPAVAAAKARPTPNKRVPVAVETPSEPVPPIERTVVLADDTADALVESHAAPAAPPALTGRLSLFLGRRPFRIGRRPALCLTAAVVGAIALSAFSLEEPAAQPAAVSQSVSVAEQLGIRAESTVVLAEDDTERLGELAVSRNVRDAEQAAAAQVQFEADRIAAEAAAAAAAEAARPKAVMPVEGARLTSPFGPRWGTLHAGVDLAAPMRTPEYAAMDGVVLEAGPASGFGLVVYLQHENGDVTVYGHMDEILVEAGQVVRAGDTIALVGNRGQSTGPHLHFEVRAGGLGGEKIDPLPWLRSNGVDV